MLSDSRKRKKKSGVEFRKANKSRLAEEAKLSSLMAAYFNKQKDKGGEPTHDESLCEDPSTTADSTSGAIESKGNVDDEIKNPPSPRFEATPEEYTGHNESDISLISEQSVMVSSDDTEIGFTAAEGQHDTSILNVDQIQTVNEINYEETLGCSDARSERSFQGIPQDSNNDVVKESERGTLHDSIRDGTIDPAFLSTIKLSIDDKEMILKLKPCPPPQNILRKRKSFHGKTQRCCTQQAFFHNSELRRQWVSYSLSKDALFCIPCILFSDATLRGEHRRLTQGNAFMDEGFQNWKKQNDALKKHERSETHRSSKVAEALFLQKRSVNALLNTEMILEEQRLREKAKANRNVMKRIVDAVMFLGRQGLALRGHRESLMRETQNSGNFLELLKLLSQHDTTIKDHLEKVKQSQEKICPSSEEVPKLKGRGSKLTFLSNRTQNKMIDIVSSAIKTEISRQINDGLAWALMADTTPDVSRQEQLSICVRIVNTDGSYSEHMLNCIKASGTKADELFKVIKDTLDSHDLSFKKLVGQTYDGASNMSGCYNGLQALIKREIGDKVVYVHCYAHTLNLVLSDSAGIALDAAKLFDQLESLYLLFSRSEKTEGVFKKAQTDGNQKVRSLKRINTVRWSSRELALEVFLDRYESVEEALEAVANDISFDADKRTKAAGLLENIETKQFLATAVLFNEIFQHTGPLSPYLQSTTIDFGKALAMIDGTIDQLQRLRNHPEHGTQIVDRNFKAEHINWKPIRIRHRPRMAGEQAEDEPAETPESHWARNTFYVVMDTVLESMRNRFEKNKNLLATYHLSSPANFDTLVKDHPTAKDLEPKLNDFCTKYDIDADRCASELLSFAAAVPKFNLQLFHEEVDRMHSQDVGDEIEIDDYGDGLEDNDLIDDDHNGYYEDFDGPREISRKPTNEKSKLPFFSDALQLLCHPTYHLMDAYPILGEVYAIAAAIPVSSSTAERSFSTLKRVKSRIRSTMVQERLEGLLMMAFERKICLSIDKDELIDSFGRSSRELAKALLSS